MLVRRLTFSIKQTDMDVLELLKFPIYLILWQYFATKGVPLALDRAELFI
jgi:hypothetical protein